MPRMPAHVVVYSAGVLRAAKIARSIWVALGLGISLLPAASAAGPSGGNPTPKTPIKHLVVIFQENHSFDVYFGDLSERAQPARPAGVSRAAGHTLGQRPQSDADRAQSELDQALPDRPHAVVHLRPGPRVHGRAEGAQRRPDGPVRPLRRAAAVQCAPVLPQVAGRAMGHGDGLLRRQHRHRATGTTRSTSRSATTASPP